MLTSFILPVRPSARVFVGRHHILTTAPSARFAAPKSTSKAKHTMRRGTYTSHRRAHAHLTCSLRPFLKSPKASHIDARTPTRSRNRWPIPAHHTLHPYPPRFLSTCTTTTTTLRAPISHAARYAMLLCAFLCLRWALASSLNNYTHLSRLCLVFLPLVALFPLHYRTLPVINVIVSDLGHFVYSIP